MISMKSLGLKVAFGAALIALVGFAAPTARADHSRYAVTISGGDYGSGYAVSYYGGGSRHHTPRYWRDHRGHRGYRGGYYGGGHSNYRPYYRDYGWYSPGYYYNRPYSDYNPPYSQSYYGGYYDGDPWCDVHRAFHVHNYYDYDDYDHDRHHHYRHRGYRRW
jgi:hypothetical protein